MSDYRTRLDSSEINFRSDRTDWFTVLAGLKSWPKLFQNLRSTRQTELAEQFPAHVVCAWMGNSEDVARDHYLQVTDAHFEAACSALRNPVQLGAASTRSESHGVQELSTKTPCIVPTMGGTGLEPVTPTV